MVRCYSAKVVMPVRIRQGAPKKEGDCMTEHILLRNAGYEPMKYIDLRKAHGQLIRGKTSIIKVAEGDHFYGGFPIPAEVILKRYVKMT